MKDSPKAGEAQKDEKEEKSYYPVELRQMSAKWPPSDEVQTEKKVVNTDADTGIKGKWRILHIYLILHKLKEG